MGSGLENRKSRATFKPKRGSIPPDQPIYVALVTLVQHLTSVLPKSKRYSCRSPSSLASTFVSGRFEECSLLWREISDYLVPGGQRSSFGMHIAACLICCGTCNYFKRMQEAFSRLRWEEREVWVIAFSSYSRIIGWFV